MKNLLISICLLLALNLNADQNTDNQLVQAAGRDDLPAVKKALADGANINAKDSQYGYTALLTATALGKTETVKYLLARGAAIDKEALMSAACWGRIELMDLLLKHGADINATNKSGQTALMSAAFRDPGEPEAVKYLLDHGANVNARNEEGATALMMAAPVGATNVIKLLLDKGADPNVKPADRDVVGFNSAALIVAAETGNIEVVKLLLEHGADVNIKGSIGGDNGVTPLIVASQFGHLEIINLLLDKGADINAKRANSGETSLSWAVEYGQTNIAKLLLNRGAAVNEKANDGNTALFPPDPVVENKKRVERFHAMVLAQDKMSPVWYSTAGENITKQAKSKLLVRPPGIDDEGWERYQMMLGLIFQGNQPIEFYARVVDQNEEPVVGARLELRLSGVDTDKLLAKFPHMNMGEEQTNWTKMVYSDADGWVRLKGIAGHYLNVWTISKEGYLSKYQDNIAGTVIYETNCVTQTGHLGTTGELTMDVFNPKKGYTFHLSKIK